MVFSRNDNYLYFERLLDRFLGPPLLLSVRFLMWSLGRTGNRRSSPDARKVLLIKFHGIGNLVMMLPAVRSIRQRHPEAQLHFLTLDTNRGILELMGETDRDFFLDRKNLWSLALSSARFLVMCRKERYEAVFDFEQFSYFSAILSLLAAPNGHRFGFDNPAHHRASAYTAPVPYLETEHMSSIFRRLAEGQEQMAPAELFGGLTVNPANQADVRKILKAIGIGEEDVLVILHPGSSGNLLQRRWPPERFAALADDLIRKHEVKVVFTGTAEEKDLVKSILGRMRNEAWNLSGALTLGEYVSLCALSKLTVANDTAAVHIAAAVGTPVVGLYGPNTPHLYGPGKDGRHIVFYEHLPCSPCIRNSNRKLSRCSTPRCMEAIHVEAVSSRISSRYFDATGRILPAFRKARTVNSSPIERLSIA